MDSAVLNRDIFLQIKGELVGKHDKYVEVMPGVKARVVQLTADAGFALISLAQKDLANEEQAGGEKKESGLGKNSYRWICASVLDMDGLPVFTMEDFKDLPFELVQRLTRVVNEVNGLSAPDAAENAEKN